MRVSSSNPLAERSRIRLPTAFFHNASESRKRVAIIDGAVHIPALESLRETQVKLNTYNLKQRKQIVQRVESILAKGYCQKLIRYEIQVIRHYKRIYERKGRSQKGDSYRTVWSQNFTLTYDVDKDEVEKDEKTEGTASLPIYPEGRCCPSPTIFDIVRLFRNVERYEVVAGDEITIFPAELSAIQKKLLELLDVPIAEYQ